MSNLLARLFQKSRCVLSLPLPKWKWSTITLGVKAIAPRWFATSLLILSIVFIFLENRPPVFAQACKPSKPCDPTKYNINQPIERGSERCHPNECEISCRESKFGVREGEEKITRKCAPKGTTTEEAEWVCPPEYPIVKGKRCCRYNRKTESDECSDKDATPTCKKENFEWDSNIGKCVQKHWEGTTALRSLCDVTGNLPNSQEQKQRCENCIKSQDEGGEGGIWTAIGCIPTKFDEIIRDYVFKTGMSIAGGIAFLYFLYGAFLVLTSAGNPEKIEEAKQIMTSALAGLLLIIFSIFLLRIIGVDILALPGFG